MNRPILVALAAALLGAGCATTTKTPETRAQTESPAFALASDVLSGESKGTDCSGGVSYSNGPASRLSSVREKYRSDCAPARNLGSVYGLPFVR
ncbi:MAG TPA: hypothetical protein VIL32_03190 [Steroidobacteraceae bacterium]